MKKPMYLQPHCILFSIGLVLMAFTARRYDGQVFLFDLIVAIIFGVIIILSGIKFRRYVNKVVKDAVRGIKGIDHTYLEKFSLPAVVIGKTERYCGIMPDLKESFQTDEIVRAR